MSPEQIQERIKILKQNENHYYQKYTDFRKALKIELEKVIAECPHEHTRYSGDPSGGTDISTYCLDCGAERPHNDSWTSTFRV